MRFSYGFFLHFLERGRYVLSNVAHQRSNQMIEQIGLESVPKEQRTTSFFQYFIMQMAIVINAGNFLVPSLAVLEGGLSPTVAIIATVCGATFAFIFVSILSIPGAKYGIPAQYALRVFLGVNGSRFFASPVRALISLYWFGVQAIVGTYLLQELLQRFFNIEIPFLPFVLTLATIMAFLALVGFHAVKKISIYFLPIIIFTAIIMLFILMKNDSSMITSKSFTSNHDISTIIFYASLAFVQYITMVSSSSDLARFAKSPKHGFYGLFFGNVVGFTLTAILGIYSAYLYQNTNPFISASSLTDNIFIIVLIVLTAMSSMLIVNINNAYTGGYSLLNSIPRLGRVNSAIIFGIIGIICSIFPSFVENASQFISLLGLFIVPLSAVIITDFIFLKNLKFRNDDFEKIKGNYRYNNIAIIVIIISSIIYFFIPEKYSPGFIIFFFSSILYFISAIIMRKIKFRRVHDGK